MWQLEEYPHIFTKKDYLIFNDGTPIPKKVNLRVHVNGNSSVVDRYNAYKNDLKYARKRITHYMIDSKLCIRVIKEDFQTFNVWQNPTDITLEVFGADHNKAKIEEITADMLRALFDKFGWDKSRVKFSGESYKLSKERILRLASIGYEKTASVIETCNENLISLGHVLKDYCFPNVTTVEIDGHGLSHWEVIKRGYAGDLYYLSGLGYKDNRQTIISYLRWFVDKRINSLENLKKVEYVCYFNDKQKYLAEMFGYLANASVFKDNGRTMESKDITKHKAEGRLLYIGDIGVKETIKHFCTTWLV